MMAVGIIVASLIVISAIIFLSYLNRRQLLFSDIEKNIIVLNIIPVGVAIYTLLKKHTNPDQISYLIFTHILCLLTIVFGIILL